LVHHFTVDVEEYFHPTAMAAHFPTEGWASLPRRSPAVIDRLLELLSRHGTRGTFFVVGWLAEQEPAMVRAIAAEGHELASHGQEHALVASLGPAGFRSSVRRSKAVIEDISARPAVGYRAPSFSIVPGMEWAFDILAEEGYSYDASLFPIVGHPTYGYPTLSRDPHWLEREGAPLAEFPAMTVRLLGRSLPASGGAYFRLLPLGLTQWGFRQAASRGAPGMFYIHPWELDDWKPDVAAPWLQRVRTFAGRRRCWRRLERLLDEFSFGRVDASLATLGATS
jgi:polysaccharide deacetylase family protein (PEP-CTERM system associated)